MEPRESPAERALRVARERRARGGPAARPTATQTLAPLARAAPAAPASVGPGTGAARALDTARRRRAAVAPAPTAHPAGPPPREAEPVGGKLPPPLSHAPPERPVRATGLLGRMGNALADRIEGIERGAASMIASGADAVGASDTAARFRRIADESEARTMSRHEPASARYDRARTDIDEWAHEAGPVGDVTADPSAQPWLPVTDDRAATRDPSAGAVAQLRGNPFEEGEIAGDIHAAGRNPGVFARRALDSAAGSAPELLLGPVARVAGGIRLAGSMFGALGAANQMEQAASAHRDPATGGRTSVPAGEAALAVGTGALSGATELVPLEGLFRIAGRAAAALPAGAREGFSRAVVREAGRFARDVGGQAAVDVTQEEVQNAIENVGAHYGWDPSTGLFSGAIDAAGAALLMGGGSAAVAHAAGRLQGVAGAETVSTDTPTGRPPGAPEGAPPAGAHVDDPSGEGPAPPGAREGAGGAAPPPVPSPDDAAPPPLAPAGRPPAPAAAPADDRDAHAGAGVRPPGPRVPADGRAGDGGVRGAGAELGDAPRGGLGGGRADAAGAPSGAEGELAPAAPAGDDALPDLPGGAPDEGRGVGAGGGRLAGLAPGPVAGVGAAPAPPGTAPGERAAGGPAEGAGADAELTGGGDASAETSADVAPTPERPAAGRGAPATAGAVGELTADDLAALALTADSDEEHALIAGAYERLAGRPLTREESDSAAARILGATLPPAPDATAPDAPAPAPRGAVVAPVVEGGGADAGWAVVPSPEPAAGGPVARNGPGAGGRAGAAPVPPELGGDPGGRAARPDLHPAPEPELTGTAAGPRRRPRAQAPPAFLAEHHDVLAAEAAAEQEALLAELAERGDEDPAAFLDAAAASRNPLVLLAAHDEALRLEEEAEQAVPAAVAAAFEGGARIGRSMASDVAPGREEGRPDWLAVRAYFAKPGVPAPTPDELAARISEESGLPVSGDDVVDFVRSHRGGPSAYRAEARRPRRKIEGALREALADDADGMAPISDARVAEMKAAAFPARSAGRVEYQADDPAAESYVPFRRAPTGEGAAPAGNAVGAQEVPGVVEAAARTLAAEGMGGQAPAVVVLGPGGPAPAPLQRMIAGAARRGFDTPGFYHGGRVYLDPAGIAREAERSGRTVAEVTRETVLHELVAHRGLRGVLGEAFAGVMARTFGEIGLDRIRAAGILGAYADQLSTSDPAAFSPADRALLAEEYLARLAQGAVSTDPTLRRRIYETLRLALRRALRRLGLAFEVDDRELALMLVAAADHLRREGRVAPEGAARFSRGAPPDSPFVPGGDPAAQRAAAEAKPDAPVTSIPAGVFANFTEAQEWFREHVQGGGPFENVDTGWAIAAPRSARRETFSEKASAASADAQRHVDAVRALPELLRRAVLVRTHPDTKGEPGVVAMHRFVAPLQIGPALYRVKLTVKERADGHRHYVHQLTEIDKPAGISPLASAPGRGAAGAGGAAGSTAGSSVPVRALLEGVSPEAFSGARFSLRPAGDGQASDPDALRVRLNERLQAAGLDRAAFLASLKAPPGAEARPDLANPGQSAPVRDAVDAVDARRNEAGRPTARTSDDYDAGAARIPAEGVRRAITDGRLDTPELVRAAMRLIESEGAAALASGDRAAVAAFAELVDAYREARAETARALGAGADVVEAPEQRRRRLIVEAVFEPAGKARRALDRAKAGPEARAAKEAERRAREAEREAEQKEAALQAALRRLRALGPAGAARAEQVAAELGVRFSRPEAVEMAALEAEIARLASERDAARERAKRLRGEAQVRRRAADRKTQKAREMHVDGVEKARRALRAAGVQVELLAAPPAAPAAPLAPRDPGDLGAPQAPAGEGVQADAFPVAPPGPQDPGDLGTSATRTGDGAQVDAFPAAPPGAQDPGDLGASETARVVPPQQLPLVLTDPVAAAEAVTLAHVAKGGSAFDMAVEYWRAGLLSLPSTHTANVLGNSVNGLLTYGVQRPIEALVGSLVPGRKADAATVGELRHLYAGLTPGAVFRALQNAAAAFRSEVPVTAARIGFEGDTSGKMEQPVGAIPGRTGRAVRLPYRVLLAADEIAKSMVVSMEVGAQAYRIARQERRTGADLQRRIAELTGTPGSAAYAQAYDAALGLTFQSASPDFARGHEAATGRAPLSKQGAGSRTLSSARREYPALNFVLPFVETPINILSRGVRLTPAGLFPLAYHAARGSGRRVLLPRVAEQLVAGVLTAAVFGIVGGQGDDEPRITGSRAPFGEPGRSQMQERAVPATSIRVGGTYYDYSRLAPIGQALVLLVDAAEAHKRGDGEAWGQAFGSMTALVRDATFLQGLGDVIRALESDDKAVDWATNFGASWAPNVVRGGLRAADGTTRDTRGDVLARAFPLLADAPVKHDLWGRPLHAGERAFSDVLWRLTIPVRTERQADVHDLDRLIYHWNARADAPLDGEEGGPYYPTLPQRPKGWENERYQELVRRAGERARARLEGMIRDGRLSVDEPTAGDIETLARVVRETRRAVKREMEVENP